MAEIKVKDGIEAGTVQGVEALESDKYKYGFESDIEQEFAPKGLNEDIVRFISAKKNEPDWMLKWRLDAYARWLTMEEPSWAIGRLSRNRLPRCLLLCRAEI